jgi:hypothetical protein
MPNYPSDLNRPNLTIDNVEEGFILHNDIVAPTKDTYNNYTIERTEDRTATLADLTTAVTALTTELGNLESAISGIADDSDKQYVSELFTPAITRIHFSVEKLVLQVKRLAKNIEDNSDAPGLLSTKPSGWNRLF